MSYKSERVYEPVKNYTICVKIKAGIRPMKFDEDIEEDLVYINHIAPFGVSDIGFIISEGEQVRYVEVLVTPKFNFS
jgi:hypothetical protein